MSDKIRIHDEFEHPEGDQPNPIWVEIEQIVLNKRTIRPFDQSNVDHPEFKYIQSTSNKERFEIIQGHSRYKTTVEAEAGAISLSDTLLGPIEREIVTFCRSPNPHLGVLVGGMGSGKSTTLKYLIKEYLSDLSIQYCDFDGETNSETSAEGVQEMLSNYLSNRIDTLISPHEEFRNFWTWGLNDRLNINSAIACLSDARRSLRIKFENDWLNESESAIEVRKQCCEALNNHSASRLSYLSLKIDYYLSVKCAGNRGMLLFVLDNVDPLPPMLQYELLRAADKVQHMAKCKFLIAMRPLTYTRHKDKQTANRTVYFIEHLGPPAIVLIENKINNLVVSTEMPELTIKYNDENGNEVIGGQNEAKSWIREIIYSLQHQTQQHQTNSEPNASEFLDGVCNNSLRCALVLAPKLFGSPVIPIALLGLFDNTTKSSGTPRIRTHELIRAILIGSHSHFECKPGEVIENIFDLDSDAIERSCTSKIRALRKLQSSDNEVTTFSELVNHLKMFGYSEHLILDTINALISQVKRLAWSDSIVSYESINQLPNSRIKLTKSGKFYVSRAIYSLEYVQEVHVDVHLPKNVRLTKYSHNKFSQRMLSLYHFVRYINDIDRGEVKKILTVDGGGKEYCKVYGQSLFSSEMYAVLGKQVENVGRAMLITKAGQKYQSEIDESLTKWKESIYIDKLDAEIIKKLESI